MLLLLTSSGAAQDRVARLADQLANSDDFRVRTQAALALGASKNKRALSPLCSGLSDGNTTVRAAAAAGLGRLALLGGAACLKRRMGVENASSVKATIKKALGQIEAGETVEEAPAVTASTRYYVAIGKTADKTGRNGAQVDEMVRGAMRRAAESLDGYAVAPNSESPPQARQLFSKYKKIKGFYLAPKVMPPKYSDGNLVIQVEVAIFSYPDKTLRGSLPIKLTQQDVAGRDTSAEDELIRMAAERAMEKFSKNVERIE
ncbi:MAG TPA: HEAT repeat domain-containing protein [Polyangiaceae bacterium]|nr:HEAT repeat domain-containing protein [Polyangiaceae bacterium]